MTETIYFNIIRTLWQRTPYIKQIKCYETVNWIWCHAKWSIQVCLVNRQNSNFVEKIDQVIVMNDTDDVLLGAAAGTFREGERAGDDCFFQSLLHFPWSVFPPLLVVFTSWSLWIQLHRFVKLLSTCWSWIASRLWIHHTSVPIVMGSTFISPSAQLLSPLWNRSLLFLGAFYVSETMLRSYVR